MQNSERNKNIIEICENFFNQESNKTYTGEFIIDPLLEFTRYNIILDLQCFLQNLCCKKIHDYELLSFQRWYFITKMLEKNKYDPLIPYGHPQANYSLQEELITKGVNYNHVKEICELLLDRCKNITENFQYIYQKTFITIHNFKNHKSICLFQNKNILKISTVSNQIFEKLRCNYKSNNFNRDLFCLLIRYNAIQGETYQRALPDSLFQVLQDHLGITTECFASAFNHYLSNYYSLFYDIEKHFGSSGNFFEANLLSGSYQLNPPFIEEIIAVMSTKILYYLEKEEPFSFTVIIPAWLDTYGYILLRLSKFVKYHEFFEKRQHYYKEGSSYNMKLKLANCRTAMIILQNDTASEKWNLTKDIKLKIFNAFSL